MNKTEVINKLADKLDGDKKEAQTAVEGFIDIVQREVKAGRKVSISGFGVFEKRARAARTARNPRTGEAVKVKKTNVPSFRPGTAFKDIVSGRLKMPKASAGLMSARAMTAAAKDGDSAAGKGAPKRATGTRSAAGKSAAKKTTTGKGASARASASKPAAGKTTGKAAPKRATGTSSAASKSAPKKTTGKAGTKKAAPKKTAAAKK